MKINLRAVSSLFLGAILSVAITSCDKAENYVTPEQEEDNNNTETIYPVNFQYITFNHEGNYGEKPSISYINKAGVSFTDYLKEVNDFQVNDNPISAFQLGERMFIAHGSFFNSNGIIDVNPNTFEINRHINLKSVIRSYVITNIDDNTLIIAGDTNDTDNNLIVGDLTATDEEFIQKQINVGIPVHAMIRVGSKVFMASATSGNALIVMDIDNIAEEGIRTISESCRLTNRYNKFVTDKNGNLWIATLVGSRVRMVCINPTTEELVHEIDMPYSMTSLKETGYDIANDGTTLYVRNHKAFYILDVNNIQELDEPNYEFRDHIGELKDLKMTESGKLIIIHQRLESFAQSEVIVFDPTLDSNWEVERIQIGYQGVSIYVPNYAKGN